MKRVLVLAASAILLGSVVTAASAQGGGGRGQGRGGFGSMGMLRIPEVQTELKMTDAQKAKLDTKQQEMQQAMAELRPQGGGQPDPAEFQKMFQKIQELNDKAVADILDTTQLKRFHQLELQQAVQQGGGGFGGFGGRRGGGGGAGAPAGGQNLGVFGRKGVAEALNLTDKQKADIAKIQDESGQQLRDAMQGFDFQNATQEERQKLNDTRMKVQKDALDKSMAVLTDAQKTTWKGLLGEPFKFPAPQRRQPQA